MYAAVTATDDPTLTGLALQSVATILPAQAEMIARLSPDARREVVAKHVDYLLGRDILSSSEAADLQGLLRGGSNGASSMHATPANAKDMIMGSPPPALTVAELLNIAVTSSVPSVEFESFWDVLWDAAVTIVGVIVGDAIGGPAGAAAGGLAAHDWAQAHPPSTWEF
jgi:hypothetical protein